MGPIKEPHRKSRMKPPAAIDLSPEVFRKLGYRAVDILADQLSALGQPDHPVRMPVPDNLRERLLTQLPPAEAQDPAALLDAFSEYILLIRWAMQARVFLPG